MELKVEASVKVLLSERGEKRGMLDLFRETGCAKTCAGEGSIGGSWQGTTGRHKSSGKRRRAQRESKNS